MVKALLKKLSSGFSKKSAKSANVEDPTLLRGNYYNRTGECNLCGMCCQNIYLVHEEKTIDSIEEFETLKPENPEFQFFRPTELTKYGVKFTCSNLQEDNGCKIYDDRPHFCRVYPTEEMLLLGGIKHDDCSYEFELIKSFGEVLSEAATQKEKPRIRKMSGMSMGMMSQ